MDSMSSFVISIPQACENLGMAMIYTLVASVKEWISERFCQDANIENANAEEAAKEDVWVFLNFSYFLFLLVYLLYVCYILSVSIVSVFDIP